MLWLGPEVGLHKDRGLQGLRKGQRHGGGVGAGPQELETWSPCLDRRRELDGTVGQVSQGRTAG